MTSSRFGDFNIDRKDDALYKAFTSTGLTVPDELCGVPRTVFSDPKKPDLNHFFDQIAWFTGQKGIPELTLKFLKGGTFDFLPYAMSIAKAYKNPVVLPHIRPLSALGRI